MYVIGNCGGRVLSQVTLYMCFLTPSSYAAFDGLFYCKHHFSQLFKEKGSYNHLTKTASIKKNEAMVPQATLKATSDKQETIPESATEAQPDSDQTL